MSFAQKVLFICLLRLSLNILLKNNAVLCLDAPPVHIPGQGIAVGTYLKMFRTQNIKAYMGIQYAKAQRFSPPEISDIKWNGIFNATALAPDCWQKNSKSTDKFTEKVSQILNFKNYLRSSDEKYDENCLYLNIYIPDGSPRRFGYAVVVWIHGGDFSTGSPSNINPFQLVFKQKVIVVTFSYRLNIFGFLSTGDGESPGNFGLMDQAAALFWIRKNINHFGGDDQKITIMGHGSGAVCAGLHLVSGEWSKDSFSNAIIMSGNPLSDTSVKSSKDLEESLDSVASVFGCNRRPTAALIQCLRRIDPKILTDNIPLIDWGPIMDYGLSNISLPFIPEFPIHLFKKGLFYKVPLLIGVTDMEDIFSFENADSEVGNPQDAFQNYVRNLADEDIKKQNLINEECSNTQIVEDALSYMYPYRSDTNSTMISLAQLHTDRIYRAPMHLLANLLKGEESIYMYEFKTTPRSEFLRLPEGTGVPKYSDQIYLWGGPYMENLDIFQNWHPSDKKLSDIVMTLWANFVKTSNPTSSNVYIKWSPYTEEQSVLKINDDFNIENSVDNLKISFWNQYYPRVLNFAADCCNATNGCQSIRKYKELNYILIYSSALLLTSANINIINI